MLAGWIQKYLNLKLNIFNYKHQTKTKMFHTYFQKQTNEVYDDFMVRI